MTKRKLGDFRPQAQNANKHTERGLKMLDDAIAQDGYVAPMTAAANGDIIDGSARRVRVEAVMGDVEPIVIEHDGTRPIVAIRTDIPSADTPEAKRIALRANRIAQADLDWDADVLADMLATEPDVLAGLWERDELAALLQDAAGPEAAGEDPGPQISKADELQAKWNVLPGELFILGDHRLICGDSTDAGIIDRLMDGARAEMIWTDPPYGVAVGDKNKYLNAIAPSNRVEENLENDMLDEPQLVAMLRAAFGNAATHCLAGGAWYVAAPPGPLHVLFGQVLKDMGIWHQTIQWVKNNATFAPLGVDYHWRCEPIFYGWLPGAGHRYYGGRQQDTVWEIDRPAKSPEHPTMKPVELVERAITNSSKPGELVLDMFGGSGTTLLACERANRGGRLVEIAPQYVAVALERWSQLTHRTPAREPAP